MATTKISLKKIHKPQPLGDQVYDTLRNELFRGSFSSGQRITEQEIAESLGVSRTPVREALRIFRKQGILEQQHGGAYVFTTPSIEQVEEVFEIRRVLEPMAARKAVENCTAEDIERLQDIINNATALLDADNPPASFILNIEFRKIFFHLCGNKRLADYIDGFMDHIFFLGLVTLKKRNVREIVVKGQQSLVNGLRLGDPDAMEKRLKDYLDAAYNSTMKEMK